MLELEAAVTREKAHEQAEGHSCDQDLADGHTPHRDVRERNRRQRREQRLPRKQQHHHNQCGRREGRQRRGGALGQPIAHGGRQGKEQEPRRDPVGGRGRGSVEPWSGGPQNGFPSSVLAPDPTA